MSLLIILIDFGAGLGLAEAEDLHQNLYKFCGEYAAAHSAKISANDGTNWSELLEREWAWKLTEVFHNMGKTSTAPNIVLRHLLAKFNKVS